MDKTPEQVNTLVAIITAMIESDMDLDEIAMAVERTIRQDAEEKQRLAPFIAAIHAYMKGTHE